MRLSVFYNDEDNICVANHTFQVSFSRTIKALRTVPLFTLRKMNITGDILLFFSTNLCIY